MKQFALDSREEGEYGFSHGSSFPSEVNPGTPKIYFRRKHELQVRILYYALGFWSARSGVAERCAAGETSHARRWPRHPCPRAPPDRWQGDGALSSLLQGCFD